MPPKFRRDYDGPDNRCENQALLDGNSDEEDFFLRGPVNPRVAANNDHILRLQGDVDEVVDIMQTNITRVIERGDRLEDLNDKSEHLSASSDAFRIKSRSLRQQMWWKECRVRIIIGVVVLAILILIIVPIIVQNQKKT